MTRNCVSFSILKHRFKYVSNGADVEEDAPWKEDEPNDLNEGCIQSFMDGGWNDISCTTNGYALCQMPGDSLILLSPIEHFNAIFKVLSQSP